MLISYKNENLVELYKALADPTRLEILEGLKDQKEANVSDIQKSLNKGQSLVSQQLKILINTDLLVVRKEGRKKFYKIKDRHILKLIELSKDILSNRIKEDLEKKIKNLTEREIEDTLL